MGKVKAWLMEMQQDAIDILDAEFQKLGFGKCQDLFLKKHPGQVDVFANTFEEWIFYNG